MSEFVAGAFVDVKPDTKGFRDALKTKVNASIKSAGVFKVPIQFEIKAFKKQLQDAARQAKPVIPVTIGGNVATMRRDLNAKIQKATEGLAFKVPVEFTQTGAGSRGGTGGTGGTGGRGGAGGGGTGGAANKEDKLTAAQKLRANAEKALIDLDTREAVTQKLLTQATEGGISAQERAARLAAARTSANAAAKQSTEAFAKAEAVLTDAQRAAFVAAEKQALATRALVIEQQTALKLATATAATTTKVTDTRAVATTVMAVEVTEITSLNDLHVLENQLLAAEAALKRTTNKARELGLTSLAAENDLLLANIAQRKVLIATQRSELKGEGKAITQRKTGARGVVSSILSLAGLRGATLAASGPFLAGAAAAAIFTKSLKAFSDFETELNTFQAVAGATAEQMKEVSSTAEELGADITLPAVSAADAAQAMTELARAGLDVRDSLAGARGVLELAAAAQIANADAATLVASGLNAFSLSGDNAVHVADLLANAANAAQGSISEMGAALQQAAAISNQVGLSLDDTVAILTLFAKNGLRGSDAGTSLRTALARLIAPTTKASAVIADLGLNIRDANGNVRPEVFADFAEATKDLTPALRDMLAETIAGQDSIRAFAIGGREGARGLKLAQLQMAQLGTASQVAEARTKGLGGQFSALSSNAETLGIKLGSLAPPIELVTSDLNNLFSVVNKFGKGDFGGGLKEFLDFKGQETKQRLTGLKDIFSPRSPKIGKGLKELFGGVKIPQTEVEKLLETLDSFQKIRITAFGAGIPVGPITAQIKTIRAELHKAKVDAGLLVPVTPLEKIKAPFQETIKQAQGARRKLQEKGQTPSVIAQIASLDQLIKDSTPKMRAAVEKFKGEANKAMTGLGLAKKFDANFKAIATNIDFATPEILGSLDGLIADIKKVPVGSAPKALGLKIVKNIQTAINAAVDADDPALAAAILAKAQKIAALFGISLAEAFKKLKIPLTADDVANLVLPEQIAGLRAEAAGNVSGQIAAKQAELAGLNKGLAGVRKGTQNEADVLSDIIGVQGEIASLQQEAVSGADTKVLDAISDKEQALQNQLTLAQTTKSLTDDLKAERRLRAFYIKQVQIVAQTVKDKQTRNDAIKDLKQKLFDLDLDIAGTIADKAEQIFDDAAQAAEETVTLADDLRVANRRVRFWENQVKIRKDLVRKRKATAAELQVAQDSLDAAEKEAKTALQNRRQQQRENRQERLDLRIQIAQSTGNVKAEIRAREAQIKNTQDLIRQTRRGSLQRLRLIAQLRQEQRELRDLKKEKEKTNQATKSLIFTFLQTQQGFAANLLGNLIPQGATSGIVGGTTGGGGAGGGGIVIGGGGVDPLTGRPLGESGRVPDPSKVLSTEAGVGAKGPTRGGQSTQIHLLRQIKTLLADIKRGTGHPEARYRRQEGPTRMDMEQH